MNPVLEAFLRKLVEEAATAVVSHATSAVREHRARVDGERQESRARWDALAEKLDGKPAARTARPTLVVRKTDLQDAVERGRR